MRIFSFSRRSGASSNHLFKSMLLKGTAIAAGLGMSLPLVTSVQASEAVTRSVEVQTVSYQETARPISISALLAYKSTQKLAFKVGGPVAEILVEEGDAIKKGQTLARLDTEEVQARVQEAEARFENATRNVERLEKLYRNKVVSLDQLQDAETELDVARSQLSVARFNLRYSTIQAPQDGRIIRRMIETSELVAPNQVAFVLADESRGWIMRTGLSDRKVVLIKHGDPVEVRFDPWPLKAFNGKVSEIAEAAEERSGLFEVEIALDPVTEIRLRDGYVGRIHIEPGVKERVVKLPALSLVSAMSPLGTVYVLNDDNTVSSRSVRIHYLDGGDVAISGELQDGEQVVTTGAAFLDQGDKVRVVGEGEG
ncbi:efflux RND transporter periplasmic adaptor subunit [Parendozoicomonas haliclonae]|uniref:Toluene efflux pump periplasmic linker protein TtgD n=1 Tax=Parendozoicomonas haliclonae TaxID=1960125 RepID=A0A1X7AN84_9GAMM|nr:efflux RND transporter periplasmic adaptor subunit [Parendozoicomonas haliclonae]SMA49540.1 Toluene efflux pump periplasmic linker protein TtgD precursor [Parendozoicomonas haliclonae]